MLHCRAASTSKECLVSLALKEVDMFPWLHCISCKWVRLCPVSPEYCNYKSAVEVAVNAVAWILCLDLVTNCEDYTERSGSLARIFYDNLHPIKQLQKGNEVVNRLKALPIKDAGAIPRYFNHWREAQR